MKQTITPERLLGEYIGELNGICVWDIPEQLREKLERRAKELQELLKHKYKDTERGEILYPPTITPMLLYGVNPTPQTDFSVQDWIDSMKNKPSITIPNMTESTIIYLDDQQEDVFDITTMD